jgi:hypothetical protein
VTAGLAFVALAGAVLGLRFKLFILAPMILIIGVAIVAAGTATGQGWPAILLTLVAAISCLQISYLLAGIVGAYLHQRTSGPKPDLFRGVCTAIGEELQTLYPVAEKLPPEMIALLRQIN